MPREVHVVSGDSNPSEHACELLAVLCGGRRDLLALLGAPQWCVCGEGAVRCGKRTQIAAGLEVDGSVVVPKVGRPGVDECEKVVFRGRAYEDSWPLTRGSVERGRPILEVSEIFDDADGKANPGSTDATVASGVLR